MKIMYQLSLFVGRPNQGSQSIRVKRLFGSKEEAYNWIESEVWPDIFPGVSIEEHRKTTGLWRSWSEDLNDWCWLGSQLIFTFIK
ncbi:MAG: hypothetical protein CL582_23125 [Alteromonadaceae bacterium]|nr:hypothetical protein [Alteromonadaceae bacterium]